MLTELKRKEVYKYNNDYMTRKLGVHGLVQNKSGLYLVLKRSEQDIDEGNCWDPIGGGIEEGESIEEGFKREAMEEGGIGVNSIQVTYAYTDEDNGLQLIVSAKTNDEIVNLSPEHNEYKWIKFEEIKTINPVSLHLKAIQYMLKNGVYMVKYEDYK